METTHVKKQYFWLVMVTMVKVHLQELLSNVIGYIAILLRLKVNEFDERFKLSVLEGKTAVIGDDVPVGVYVDDSSNFKSVVTGDPVLVEFKNKPLYRATFKVYSYSINEWNA
ncbi:Putative DNA primase [Staphylococcus aureus]|nr:Putative DNA primase [Staphylococcus aureus]